MNCEDAQWLVDLCLEPYLKTRHKGVQSQVTTFILNYDFKSWDTNFLRERFVSFQFRLRIMEIRRRLSNIRYEDEHAGLREELNTMIEDARELLIAATEDPRLQFTSSRQ